MAIKVSGTEVISDDKRILNNESLPDIRPSLLLDFANSKTLDPRITFTRGSTATYWDGKTTAKAEENLLKYSQEFDNGYWTKTRVTVTADDTTAPDGTTTADLLTANGSGEVQLIARNGIISEETTSYALSVFAKAGTLDYVVLSARANVSDVMLAVFDLSAGAVDSTNNNSSGTIDATDIIDVGNGWYRCVMEITTQSSGNTDERFTISPSDGTFVSGGYYSGSTAGSIHAWGAQLEQRSSATAYTATTDSPIVKYQPVLQTAASGEARFDHDPVTGESKGLLIEEARTNTFTNSGDMDGTGWSTLRATLSAGNTSPDGSELFLLVEASETNGNGSAITQTVSVSAATHTMSVFAKASPGDAGVLLLRPQLSTDFSDAVQSWFDLEAGTVLLTAASSGSSVITTPVANIEDWGNGVYRCILTFTSTGAVSVLGRHYLTDANGSLSVTAGKQVQVWGAQVEEGSFPTSYIPTSGSTVTRAGDDVSITGSNFSSFFSNQAGTIYCEYGQIHEGNSVIGERLVTVYPSSNTTVKYNLEGYRAEVRYETAWDGVNFNNETRSGGKVAVAFDDTGFSAASLGVFQGSVTRHPYSQQAGRMFIGSAFGSSHTNACIPKIAYYPQRLSNATLQAMTEE
jgi:hypothetical protein